MYSASRRINRQLCKVDAAVSVACARLFRGKQTTLETFGATPFVCGYVVGTAGVMPGETQRLTLTVDDELCEGGGKISMVSMLGERTRIVQIGGSANC